VVLFLSCVCVCEPSGLGEPYTGGGVPWIASYGGQYTGTHALVAAPKVVVGAVSVSVGL